MGTDDLGLRVAMRWAVAVVLAVLVLVMGIGFVLGRVL